MAVGCSHGHWADPSALEAVLKFRDIYKPDTVIHLGDYTDTTALRAGASAKDRSTDLEADMKAGIAFVGELGPDVLVNGNHDIRMWEGMTDPDSRYATLCKMLVQRVKDSLPNNCTFLELYSITQQPYVQLADTKFMHGFSYNDNAVRDTAETHGKCVMAHLHKVSQVPARRDDGAVGYCVGYLGDITKFGYAERRRATLQWSQGFAWGEYSDKECRVRLEERNKEGEWRLPL